MSLLTPGQKLNIGRLSAAYAAIDILKSGLDGGGIDLNLPIKISYVQQSIQWLYDLEPNDDSLFDTTNLLMSLCGQYGLYAIGRLNGGGNVIIPGGVTIIRSPIRIIGAMFANSLSWTGINNDGLNILPSYFLQVYWNSVNKYIDKDVDWVRTATGFDIIPNGNNIPLDFDATGANSADEFYISISK
jgi:hypothetical protein